MIGLKQLVIEGRYDSTVTAVSRRLLQVIKDSYAAVSDPAGKFSGKKIYFKSGESVPTIEDDDQFQHVYFEEVENDTIPLEFYLALKIQWIEGYNDFRKGGDAFNDTGKTSDQVPLIEIRFEIDPADFPAVLSKVAYELRDTLRHEIEHITQSGWNLKPGKYIKSDQQLRARIESGDLPPYRYFILPKEIDANIQGLYLQAKKQRRPFRHVVNDYIDLFVPDLVSTQEKEIILDMWRSRLPALSIRQEL